MPIVATEIEAKFRVSDAAAMRARLIQTGARPLRRCLEHNTHFDAPKGPLRASDRGLRIRLMEFDDGRTAAALTFKGPPRPGPLKIRQEEEAHIPPDQADAVRRILGGLGFTSALSFQKRRETFELAGAEVCLDELPELGFFLEIEAGDERTVQQVRGLLGLEDQPTVTETYTALVARRLGAKPGTPAELAFPPGRS